MKKIYLGLLIAFIGITLIVIGILNELIGPFDFIRAISYNIIISWQDIGNLLSVIGFLMLLLGMGIIIYDKKLLKMKKGKIVLTLIFLILYLLFSYYSPISFCAVNFGGFSCGYFALFGLLSLPIDILIASTMDFWMGYFLYYFSLFLIITIFYLYMVSCLIVWIYDSVKKKRLK